MMDREERIVELSDLISGECEGKCTECPYFGNENCANLLVAEQLIDAGWRPKEGK